MVRLSLIVLGLLAAAWCFTGAADGMRVKIYKKSTQLSCGTRQAIKVKCYKNRSMCSGPIYTHGSERCLSSRSARYVKRCNKKRSCRVSNRFSRGPYTCRYRCVRRHRSRRRGWRKCHRGHCHYYRRRKCHRGHCHYYK
ncbi:uncharacterized protein AB9X84_016037 [Acanthopagrus schlegelii]